MLKNRILFCMTGSIACYKACSLVSLLIKNKFEVQCVTTKMALKFIGKATLEGLTDSKVIEDIFDSEFFKVHIDLVNWADLILVAPATANTINRLSVGLADDIIGLIYLANNYQKPFLIAPAMNSNMLEHITTKRSMEKLEEDGAFIFPTADGVLACGTYGKGKMINPKNIYDEIIKHLNGV